MAEKTDKKPEGVGGNFDPASLAFPSKAHMVNSVIAQNAVDKFIRAHIHNSDFSRDTPAWNHFHAVIPALVEIIATEFAEKEGN